MNGQGLESNEDAGRCIGTFVNFYVRRELCNVICWTCFVNLLSWRDNDGALVAEVVAAGMGLDRCVEQM